MNSLRCFRPFEIRTIEQAAGPPRRCGTCDGKLAVHPGNLRVRGSNLTTGYSHKLPSFGGYSLETLNLRCFQEA